MTVTDPLRRRFLLLDVFAERPLEGNPLPVVVDAEGLDGKAMLRIARWMNQSETTFLLPPTDPHADYRVRIFTLERELPFAGHPTLGTCHAWLQHGGQPREPERIVQECGAGLVTLRSDGDALAFAAPPLLREGPLEPERRAVVLEALGLAPDAARTVAWADNGPGWVLVLLDSADAVLAVNPAPSHTERLEIGVVGAYPDDHEYAYEVRTFFSDEHGNLREDPVTGSFNASAAQFMIAAGHAAPPFFAHQGTCLDRSGRVRVEVDAGETWIGGRVQVIAEGHCRV